MKFNRTLTKKSLFLTVAMSTTLVSGCMTLNPATGKKDFTPFMSAKKEDQVGKQAHPSITKQYGGENANLKIRGYVNNIGAKLASHSELSQKKFTFTVLNSDVVNAFALPGGYVYVTRGILSLFNSEAEMASVIGHEIGHVTARHSAKRQSTGMFANLGAVLVGVLTKDGDLGRIAGQAAQLGVMSYSRGQEYQSDELGVRYSSRAGYDPYGAPEMLKSLDAQHKLANIIAGKKGEKPRDDFFSTHPNTQDRVTRALAAARKTGIAAGARDQGKNSYLNAIDGMIYGDDPAQGLVRGQMFWHPSLGLTFTVPQGYKLQNGSASVVARGAAASTKGAMMIFSGGGISGGGLEDYTQQVWQKTVGNKAYLRDVQNIKVNGMKAITGWAEMQEKEVTLTLRIISIEFSDTQAYHFINVTPKAMSDALAPAQYGAVNSFRKLSAREAGKYKAKRIRIVTVKRGDTLSSLASKMDSENFKLDRFLTLNGFTRQTILKTGSRVKMIVMDR